MSYITFRPTMPPDPPMPIDDVAPTEGDTQTLLEDFDDGAPCPMHVVVLDADRRATRIVPLLDGDEVVIGRAETAHVRVDDASVSRKHATLRREGSRVVLRDMGSRNGTSLRGHVMRDREALVGPGDWLRVGATDLFVAARLPAPPWATLDAPWTPEAPPREVAASADDGIVVADPEMQKCFVLARRLAKAETTVLLLGETGVGKEVLAEQIHRHSARAACPLVRLNCASLPESLLESELFGHERGAFTGATQRRVGYVEAANGGTLFLDEVGEIPPRVQAKLLRVLEAQALARVGSTHEVAVDVRFVCATHRDLKSDASEGRFRQDFYFRVAAFTIRVPPLRDRASEIPLLAELFARRFAARAGQRASAIAPEAMGALMRYAWPGNVRELRNAIEHAVVLADGGTIGVECLPHDVTSARSSSGRLPVHGGTDDLDSNVAEFERERIVAALAAEEGNQTRAAQRLGITRSALLHRLRKYGIGPRH